MSLIEYTQSRSPDLAEYIQAVAASPLTFETPYPLQHSSCNHVHLWKIEYLSDRCDWIDAHYRVEVAKFLLEQWRLRLKRLPPY